MYGQRALCIGACAPLNYVGTSEHSYARLTPFRRLSSKTSAEVRRRVGSLAETLGLARAEVQIA